MGGRTTIVVNFRPGDTYTASRDRSFSSFPCLRVDVSCARARVPSAILIFGPSKEMETRGTTLRLPPLTRYAVVYRCLVHGEVENREGSLRPLLPSPGGNPGFGSGLHLTLTLATVLARRV